MQARYHLCFAAVFLGLLGCSKAGGSASPGTPAASAAQAGSYELVTVQRPESVAAYHKMYAASYEMCAALRKTLKMPPPAPMLQPAADYVIQRDTYVSDGRAYLTKEEHFLYTMEDMEPTPTCRTFLHTTSNTQLIRDGKMYNSSVDEKGVRQAEPPDEWSLPRDRESKVYTEAATIKGIAVKCMKMLPGAQELLTQLCIADLNPGTVADIIGKPIVLASRVTAVQQMQGAILTEPVSLRVNVPVDRAIFDAAAAP